MKPLTLLLLSFFSLQTLLADHLPLGLVGGEASAGVPYAAFVDENGSLAPIAGLPASGSISSTAINASGLGVISGKNGVNSDAYSAFVTQEGSITPVIFGYANGQLYFSNINDAGLALVGGESLAIAGNGRAVYTSSDGSIVHTFVLGDAPFNITEFHSCRMNNEGVGLISGVGGNGGTHAFVSFLYPNGTSTPFSTEFGDGGYLYAAAINNNSLGLVGGKNAAENAQAAFITPEQVITQLTLPTGAGEIRTTSVNTAGLGLIGGFADGTNNIYAAYVQTNGTVMPLLDDAPFSGIIRKSAINTDGTGLIAGENTSGAVAFAALTHPNGTITPLFTDSPPEHIESVAINNAGVGLLGGYLNDMENYLALVAPNGTVTPLSAEALKINGVSILNLIHDDVVPDNDGTFSSALYTQLSVHSSLESRFIVKNKLWDRFSRPDSLVASNELLAQSPRARSWPTPIEKKPHSIWLEPFGNYMSLGANNNIPQYSNTLGGALLGYDYESDRCLIGSAVGYAYNSIAYSQNFGHAKMQEELLTLYGAYYTDHFWINASVFGGLYQLDTVRHTLAQISSQGDTSGYLLTPHIGFASPWEAELEEGLCYLEPFISLDWVNNWQNAYTETGASGLNLHMPSLYNSLLQSEAGLRFYERILCSWGQVRLQQKLSYVNQAPFHFDPVMTSFVGSSSSFPVAIGSDKVLNMAAFQCLVYFLPKKNSSYGGFFFQATGGDSYQSYYGSLFYGASF